MKYDFDTPVNRRGTGSLKWDVAKGELPMWVADMDFKAADEITAALQKRLDNGVFGYSVITREWYDAYISWWSRRYNFSINRQWLIFCTGVVPAISSIVRKLTTPAEKVLLQTPVYNIFFNSVLNNGRQVEESPLLYDGSEYHIDFENLEQRLADPQTTLMILCNPHNPIGKIWSRETLWKIGELCKKYNVTVISDEIHCDLTDPGREYVPFASVSDACRENSVTCIAPTKAFNLAGLQTAAVSVPNPVLRHKVWRGLNTDEAAEPGAFAVAAAVAAFNEGGDWLDELREYIFKNKSLARDFIKREINGVSAVPSQATYLMWLDCTSLPGGSAEIAGFLRDKTGLYLSEGSQYGGNGAGFLRLNAACPESVLYDGLERLKKGIAAYIRQADSSRRDCHSL